MREFHPQGHPKFPMNMQKFLKVLKLMFLSGINFGTSGIPPKWKRGDLVRVENMFPPKKKRPKVHSSFRRYSHVPRILRLGKRVNT